MTNRSRDPVDELVPVDAQDRLALVSVTADRGTDARYALRSSIATIIPASAASYGYTLAVLLRSHGTPSLADTLMFVPGAIIGLTCSERSPLG